MSRGTLCVDIREQEHLIESIRFGAPSIDLEVEVAEYDVSDYFVSDKLGIEYKSHNDFLGSLGERLFTQAHELAQNFSTPVVLVGSDLAAVMYDGRHSPEAVLGFVASLTVREGVRVLFCGPDPIPMILKLAQKATTESTRSYNPVRRGGSKQEFAAGFIAALPGIGMKRAQRILEFYKTPGQAISNLTSWSTDIDGIGKKTADGAYNVIYGTPEVVHATHGSESL